jgi:hypothetical protein
MQKKAAIREENQGTLAMSVAMQHQLLHGYADVPHPGAFEPSSATSDGGSFERRPALQDCSATERQRPGLWVLAEEAQERVSWRSVERRDRLTYWSNTLSSGRRREGIEARILALAGLVCYTCSSALCMGSAESAREPAKARR